MEKTKMKNYIKRKTLHLRHKIVKYITPNLYEEFQLIVEERKKVSDVPRPMTIYMKIHLQGKLTGVEIGTQRGINAENILKELSITKLYLIDPYLPYVEDDKTWNYMETYEQAKQKLQNFENKIMFIKELSADAVNLIPDNLDFVYIDGNHRYEYVKQDILNYYPKVRTGGVLGGHDYWFRQPGVIQAVLELTKKNNWNLRTEPYDWWIIK